MKNHLDAVRSEDETANHKLWAVCDLAMGLLLTKTTNFEMREFPSEPRIPPMYFRKPADPNFVNGKVYLPADMQLLGKRAGLSTTFSHSMINKRIQLAQQIRASKEANAGSKELTVIVETADPAAEGAVDAEMEAPVADASQRLIFDPPATYSRRSAHERGHGDDVASADNSVEQDASASEHSPSVAESPPKQGKITNYFKKAPKSSPPADASGQRATRSSRSADQSAAESDEGVATTANQRTATRATRRGAARQADEEVESPSASVNGNQRGAGSGDEAAPRPAAAAKRKAREPAEEPARKSTRQAVSQSSQEEDSASSTKSTRSTRSRK